MSAFPDFHEYDGLGLAELVRARRVSPAELVDEAIARIEATNPRLNAVIRKMYERAHAMVRAGVPDGPFAGVPFLIKDLLATVEGVPTSCGARILKDVPQPHDSEMVRRYQAAGLVILGKTNTPEFGLLPYTEPEAFGPTNNPWDLTRTAGGSSGGSAAAVAAAMVPLAGGGDGGGSIRIPASCCGVFGLKPTRGRTPAGPDVGENWRGYVQEHVLTRSVRDSAAMLDAVAGPDVGAPYWAPPQERPYLQEVTTEPGRLRIAFSSRPLLGHDVDAECEKGLQATVRLLEGLGHELVRGLSAGGQGGVLHRVPHGDRGGDARHHRAGRQAGGPQDVRWPTSRSGRGRWPCWARHSAPASMPGRSPTCRRRHEASPGSVKHTTSC